MENSTTLPALDLSTSCGGDPGDWFRARTSSGDPAAGSFLRRALGSDIGTFINHIPICTNEQMSQETSADATEDSGSRATNSPEGPCCTTVGHNLSEHTIEVDVRTLSAMGNDTRYEVLRLLAATDEEVCSCDLAPELGVDQSTTSRALKALFEAGLVDRRKDGRWRYYTTTARAETILTAIDASRGERR